MKKNLGRKLFSISFAGAALMGMTLMTGCQNQETANISTSAPVETTQPETTSTADNHSESIGSLLLSVNPEIEIEYDSAGNVTEIEGLNDDGKKIIQDAQAYKGQPVQETVRSLVTDIDEAGYFDATVDGHEKNIILKLDPDSALPNDHFLTDIADDVRTLVSERQMDSEPIAIDSDDYDDNYRAKGYINAQTAEEILKAQLESDDLQFVEKDYDIDDGVYEIEFTLDNKEYEYEVDAFSGKVLEAEVDGADDADDIRDDADDIYDDADDIYDDADDVYDDADDIYDDADNIYDDADDIYDDADDVYDDADDIYDDADDIDD